MRPAIALTLFFVACGPRYLAPEQKGWDDYQPHTADEAWMRTAASMPDVRLVHRDVALLCPDFGAERAVGDGCEVATVHTDGFTSTGITGVVSAWRFDADRVLTLDTSLRLKLDADTELARGVLDPRAGDDGRRALYVQLDGEPDHFEPGDPGYLTMLDVETGEVERITEDVRDTSPWLVPFSDDVLFTSARTGLASLWIKVKGQEPRQLTNLGLTDITADFVPVPSRELVWVPGTRRAVFSAHYGTHELWSVDVDSGEAKHVGPGRMPAIHPEGGIVAVADDDPALGLQIVRYAGGEL